MAQLTKTLEWGISLKEYEEGGWGATRGRKFLPPHSMQKRFATTNGWDAEAAFDEIASVYIDLLKYRFDVLKSVPLDKKDLDGKDIFKPEVKDQLRAAIYNGIQFACGNKNVFERVTGAGVSATTFSVNVETTGWIFSSSAWGHIAWAMIESSEMSKYEIDGMGNIHWDGVDPNTILASTWMTDAQLLEHIKDYMKHNAYLFKGDKGADGKSFNLQGNAASIAEVIAKPNPQVDDVWIVNGDMILWNGSKWVNGGKIGIATSNLKWRPVNKAGVPALQTAHGEIVLLEDLSGNAQVSDLDNAAASQGFVTKRTEAKDYLKLKKIDPIVINTPAVAGGHLSYQEHYGNLDNDTERRNFLDNVSLGKWYTFNVNGEGYQALAYSGSADTSILWVGFKEFTGPNGISMEIVKGQTTEIGNATQAAPLVGEFYANTVAQVISYGGLQFLPKDVIVQLINDMTTPAISDAGDPTWNDIPGTQSTLFNPAQITITLIGSEIAGNENIQLILGSTAGDLVLDETIHVYPNVATASQNGYVSGTYKWYMYLDGANVKFVMEDSSGSLTDTTQTLTKIRRVAPRVQIMEGHYTPQTEVLKNSFNISSINKGNSTEWTLSASMTIDNLTQISLTVSGSTTWTTISGWDRVTPFYISSSTKDASNEWWVQYKVEAVPGDRTKLKLTNFNSGNFGTDNGAYNAHWVSVKGGL